MTKIETLAALSGDERGAVIDLLYRMADDALIMGHRDSEWTGLGPILEEDIAFSSMAQDEMGHAHQYYTMLHELGEADPDKLVFSRKPKQWRCAALASLPNDRDYGFCILRKFLYDSAVIVRLGALAKGALVPLSHLATKLRSEKKYHLMHGRAWVIRLGQGTDESRTRLAAAMKLAYPHALGLFEPTSADGTLARAGICPSENELQQEWASAVTPVLSEANLDVGVACAAVNGGRFGKHPDALAPLLESMQLVYNIDPTAKW